MATLTNMDALKARDPREIGKRLQEARAACGKTQQETAGFLGVAQGSRARNR